MINNDDDGELILRMGKKPFVLWLIIVIGLAASCQRVPSGAAVRGEPVMEPPPAAAQEALTAVSAPSEIAVRDMVALSAALRGVEAARTARTTPPEHREGDVVPFWFKALGTEENREIEARLAYRSPHLNMWVETGADVADAAVADAARIIETEILPTNRRFFGEEWRPGVDGDERVNILHLRQLGGVGIAYFSSSDEYVTAVNPYSNQREMLYVSLEAAEVGSDAYLATIAHEIQHMIQWNVDRNEDAWLGEGLSELAAFLNGYPPRRAGQYARQPDIQLTTLQHDANVVGAHYAAAYLFTAYFFDRFGEATTRAVARHPGNGPAGFDAALAEAGSDLTFDEVFADWLVANYLNSIGREQGVYRYDTLDVPKLTTTSLRPGAPPQTTAVHQYGADYFTLSGEAPLTLVLTGTQQTPVLDTRPRSGDYFWVSHPADESDMHLTRSLNLSDVDAATLSFWTWYDIEAGWDYGYVAVSGDGGERWDVLETASATRDNPQGNAFGPGYTGQSGAGEGPAWVQETADLTPYAGEEIWLRFQYVTDDAVHNQGWAIDDVSVPEIGFHDDAEAGSDGWQAAGFSRMAGVLPQQFLAQQILLGPDDVRVTRLELDEEQNGRWTIPLDAAHDKAVLIISGVTPFTRQTASYSYAVISDR